MATMKEEEALEDEKEEEGAVMVVLVVVMLSSMCGCVCGGLCINTPGCEVMDVICCE